MSTVSFSSPAQHVVEGHSSAAARAFALVTLVVMVAACLLAGWAPLGFSIVTVFLFAGPHNWFEARYLMSRMPPRWGPLRIYFLTGISGVLTLTAAFAALPWITDRLGWDHDGWLTGLAIWNTALVAWIVALVLMRSRQNPTRDWGWIAPVGLAVIGVNWLAPQAWDLGLIYLHPVMAMWFLDREIAVHKPDWQRAYRGCLCAVPVLLAALWWHLSATESLPGEDALTARITLHAGAGILTNVSSHLLVSTHTFLEMLHYGVWLIAIPLVSLRGKLWRLDQVPLARGSYSWRMVCGAILAAGFFAVLGFWAGFIADYATTRDVYFTVAMLHVLAEVPFLLRLL
ncbi:MAG: hypothetical protein SGJ20_12050 [Planctomycetota bacterium]|nr:hypothetical protein [Planctomycetota bacterium]